MEDGSKYLANNSKSPMMNIEDRLFTWLRSLFEHQEENGDWRIDNDNRLPFYEPDEVAEFFTLLNLEFSDVAASFSDWQLSMGLTYILNNNYSNYSFFLRDPPTGIDERLRAIDSTKVLFLDCFNSRCLYETSHQTKSENPLNTVCYEFWTHTPLTYMRKHPEKDILIPAFCNAMQYCTTLSNPACVESGIRGLSSLSKYSNLAKDTLQSLIKNDAFRRHNLNDYAKYAVTQTHH